MIYKVRGCVMMGECTCKQNKKYPPYGKWKAMVEIQRYSIRFIAFPPLMDT